MGCLSILDQINQQFEDTVKEDSGPKVKEINKEELMKDNEKTEQWLEVKKAFIVGDKEAIDKSSEFLKREVKTDKYSKEPEKEEKRSSYTSSSSSTSRSSYSSYSSSATKTKEEKAADKAKEYTDAMMKNIVKRATKMAEADKGFDKDWDIFELQKKSQKDRELKKEIKNKTYSKKVKSKISLLRLCCFTGKTLVESIQKMKNV